MKDCRQSLISFFSHIFVGVGAFHFGELVDHVMVVSQQGVLEPGSLHTIQCS